MIAINNYNSSKKTADLKVDDNLFTYLRNLIYSNLPHDNKVTDRPVGAELTQVKNHIKTFGLIYILSKEGPVTFTYDELASIIGVSTDRIRMYKEFFETKLGFINTKEKKGKYWNKTEIKYSINTDNAELIKAFNIGTSCRQPVTLELRNVSKSLYNKMEKACMTSQPEVQEPQAIQVQEPQPVQEVQTIQRQDDELMLILCSMFLRGLSLEEVKNNIDDAYKYWEDNKKDLGIIIKAYNTLCTLTQYQRHTQNTSPVVAHIPVGPIQPPTVEKVYDFSGMSERTKERRAIVYRIFDEGSDGDFADINTKEGQESVMKELDKRSGGKIICCGTTIYNDFKAWQKVNASYNQNLSSKNLGF